MKLAALILAFALPAGADAQIDLNSTRTAPQVKGILRPVNGGTGYAGGGGDPTGVVDSSAFIQSIFTAANSGNAVIVAPGIYKVTTRISVTQSAAFKMSASGVTINSTVAD